MPERDNKVILTHPADTSDIQGSWIWDTNNGASQQAVTCFFRKRFSRHQVRNDPVLRISADSRYRAYLNGRLLSRGPCRGTVEHYHYETVDLSDFLQEENVLAVEVRWYGRGYEPRAEVHLSPGFWAMIGSTIVTDPSWKVWRSPGHTLLAMPANHPLSGFYQVVDPPEDVNFLRFDPHWTTLDFDDSLWAVPKVLDPAIGRYQAKAWFFAGRDLTPREIPELEETVIYPVGVKEHGTIELTCSPQEYRTIEGTLTPKESGETHFGTSGSVPLTLVGTGTDYLIFDMGKLQTGFPRLTLDAPAGTLVEFRYAEALSKNFTKGFRDDPTGTVEGYHDIFTCRQGVNTIETFVWRTWRYLRLTVHHPDGPVTLNGFDTVFTAYPMREQAAFASSDPTLKTIWDISWWTARLCAHEHYEDCPYYEQIQYLMDTRLQALIGYLVAGDFRLARQAIRQFVSSRRSDGITMCRAPAVAWEPSIIPNFSLMLIEFVDDFYRYSGDISIVQEHWPCVEGLLRWFEQFDHGGLLQNVPYWVFSDWTLPCIGGRIHGSIGELNMRHIGALKTAAHLAVLLGKTDRAKEFQTRYRRAVQAVKHRLWSQKDGLFCDETDGTLIAEHASILAVLYDVVDADQARSILETLETRTDLARTGTGYSWYTFRAYEKIGWYENIFYKYLPRWTDQLKLHVTTWLERPEPSRSDCHAWASWIMVDFLTAGLGITPAEPGFASVRIQPQLSRLEKACGSVPTRHGTISFGWEKDDGMIRYDVTLPPSVQGTLTTFGGSQYSLSGNQQVFSEKI